LWIDEKAFTKPPFSAFLHVKHEEYGAMQEFAAIHLQAAFCRISYRLIMLFGMKATWFLLLESNENRAENMPKCKLFYLAPLDLCTKALCCEAAEIFNKIYR
jgi:hypothetical protein